MKKHTPGPWIVQAQKASLSSNPMFKQWMYRILHVPEDNPRLWTQVAVVYSKESEGNAYLMAAAPEMLSLLSRIQIAYADGNDEGMLAMIDEAIPALVRKATKG